MHTRHVTRGRTQVRGVTNRRLAAAKRALARERTKLVLFEDEVAAMQPSPEARIEYYDRRVLDADSSMRKLEAKHWRWGRRQLEEHGKHAPAIIEAWNRSFSPADGTYFADFVRTRLKRQGVSFEEDCR